MNATSGRAPTALLIRHDPEEFPGNVGRRLEERGYEVEELWISRSHDEPNPTVDFGDPGRWDLIVPLGGVHSVYDDATIGNWVGAELTFLAEAFARDIPVLGVCFGAQALAAALGGTVEPSPHPELGWCLIETDKPEVVAPGPWMQWHQDRFTVPPGATELARSDAGPQVFTIGRSLGVQFHPEVTAEIVADWLDSADPVEFEPTGADPAVIRADTDRHAAAAAEASDRLIDWYLDTVVAR